MVPWVIYFVFFQAEDGIRDIGVTGVHVCSSDLRGPVPRRPCARRGHGRGRRRPSACRPAAQGSASSAGPGTPWPRVPRARGGARAGRGGVCPLGRESVVWGKSVDLGGRRII